MSNVLRWVTYAALVGGAAMLLLVALSVPMPTRAWVLLVLAMTLPAAFVIFLLFRESDRRG